MPSFRPDIAGVKKTLRRYPFPQDIIIESSAFCNLKCIMCPQPFLTRKRGAMSFRVFKKIIDEVAVESPRSRIWIAIMGEPLLLKDKLIRMIRYGIGKGLELHLNTNAEFLTKSMADQLIKAKLDEIIVGLDAATKETFDKIRIGGDFDLIVGNVEYLLKAKKKKPHVVLQFIVMDENEREMAEFKERWLERGATVKIRQKLGWGAGVKADNLDLPESERFPCSWLARTVSIHWTGKFAQCDGDWDGKYSPGDINKQTIKEVWEGELARRRARHWRMDFSHELCAKCKDWQAGRSQFFYSGESGHD